MSVASDKRVGGLSNAGAPLRGASIALAQVPVGLSNCYIDILIEESGQERGEQRVSQVGEPHEGHEALQNQALQ